MMRLFSTAFNNSRHSTLLTAVCMLAFMCVLAPASYAQPSDDFARTSVQLEEILVTGAASGKTRLESGDSAYSLSAERIREMVPRGVGEIFRAIPGFRSESSSGDNNLNLSVRGIPIATGGAKFVQIHEDGLPVLQYGDIIVATADSYIMFDQTVSRIEALKGGKAATFASNSPGGIINFVGKTGATRRGSVSQTLGVDYDTFRTDYEWGTPIGDSGWSIHFGGFFREGEGVRAVDFDAERGGQLKVTAFKTFEDKGYLRLYTRVQDTRSPVYLPTPMQANGDNLQGYDHQRNSGIISGLRNTVTSDLGIADRGVANTARAESLGQDLSDFTNINAADPLSTRESDIGDGVNVDLTTVGGEFHYNFGAMPGVSNFSVTERLRISNISGGFYGNFSAAVVEVPDSSHFQSKGDRARFLGALSTGLRSTEVLLDQLGLADGSALQATFDRVSYRIVGDDEIKDIIELPTDSPNGLLQNVRSFDNDIQSLDNITNDLSFNLDFGAQPGIDNINLTVGWYYAQQDIDIDWFWQTYIATVSDDPQLVEIIASDINAPTRESVLNPGGIAAYGAPDWGNCCYRHTTLETEVNAFYAGVDLQVNEDLSFNFSFRYDDGKGDGEYVTPSTALQPLDTTGTVSIYTPHADPRIPTHVDFLSATDFLAGPYSYSYDYLSYSIGVNWVFSDNSALYANISQGGRASADRIGDAGRIDAYSTSTSVRGVADDFVVNTVDQFEFGIKHQREHFAITAALFFVETEDNNSDATDGSGTARLREYESTGLEFQIAVNYGLFDLDTSFTFTDAEITAAPMNNDQGAVVPDTALVGNTPRRQADFVYTMTPSFAFGRHRAGLSLIGTSDAYSDDANTESLKMDGYTYINVFGNFSLIPDTLSLNIGVNNLFNTIGITEIEGIANGAGTTLGQGSVNSSVIRARSIPGRSTNITLRYDF